MPVRRASKRQTPAEKRGFASEELVSVCVLELKALHDFCSGPPAG